MSRAVMVSIEGVLAHLDPYGGLGAAKPIPAGRALITTLAQEWMIIYMTAVEDPELVEAWRRRENLPKPSLLYAHRSHDPRVEEWKPDLTRIVRSQGIEPDLLIDPSPAVVAACLRRGVTSMLFADPAYIRPEWSPDTVRGPRQWTTLVQEIEKHKVLQADRKDA